jgi:pimeloyl-ACP methyl ester carboxylesterase
MTGTALLIHGLSSSPAGWWRVRGWLEQSGWTTEVVSLLGHDQRGPAPGYALEAYVDDVALSAPGPHDLVVGHSLGGSIATVLASRDADWARRMVLLDPVWFVPEDQLAAVAEDQLSELEWTPDSLYAAKPHWHDHDLAAKLFAVSAVDPEAVGRTFAEADRWDLRDAARRILTPTLVLGGDPAVYTMLEPADGEQVSGAAAELEYRIVPGAGHSPHRDAPEATRALLFEWLDR